MLKFTNYVPLKFTFFNPFNFKLLREFQNFDQYDEKAKLKLLVSMLKYKILNLFAKFTSFIFLHYFFTTEKIVGRQLISLIES